MSFLLDTNICSAFLKGDPRVFSRFIQHSGGLYVSAISVGELYCWVFRSRTKRQLQQGLTEMLADVQFVPIDYSISQRFGQERAALLDRGLPTPEVDLLIGCTALVHDLTLVTHNIRDFESIPGLRVEDWLS